MSLAPRCPFCVKLSLARATTVGQRRKCPVCKGELIVVPSSGATYRVATPEEPVADSKGGRRVLVTGVGIAVLLTGVIAAWALRSRTKADPEVAAQVAQVTPPAPRVLGPVRTSPWDTDEADRERIPAPRDEEPTALKSPQSVAVARPALPTWERIAQPRATAEQGIASAAARRPRLLLRLHSSSPYTTEDDHRALLARVPEVALEQQPGREARSKEAWEQHEKQAKALHDQLVGARAAPKPLEERKRLAAKVKEARQQLEKQAKALHNQFVKDPEAFVVQLERERADLAGLPFLKGKECRLSDERARTWSVLSRALRNALADVRRTDAHSQAEALRASPDPLRAWSYHVPTQVKAALDTGEGIAALQHFLQVESPPVRLALVKYLAAIDSRAAGEVLARRAVFDLDPKIREQAQVALKGRPAAHYAPVLLEGLRYPYLPVVEHTAEAIVNLKMKEAVPQLLDMLAAPDPDAPFLGKMADKEVPVVRELVRINHFRNCLLCHPPSFGWKEQVRGLVPVPGEPIPEVAYYSERRGGLFVRADVTYLRQDFSVLLPVAESKPWPAQQRYDFLVLTRPLTKEERAIWKSRGARPEAGALSPYKEALLWALEGLTSEDGGTTAAEWRERLSQIRSDRRADWPVWWRRQCVK
jgi:hypothetical protein